MNGVINVISNSKLKQESSNVSNDTFNHITDNLHGSINVHNSLSTKHRIILVVITMSDDLLVH